LATILLVEDNDRSARLIVLALHGHAVTRVGTAASAYRKLDDLAEALDLLIVDRHLSRTGNTLDASGDDVLEYAFDHYPDIGRIMITAAPRAGDVDDVKAQFGLSALLVKTEQGYGAPGLRRAVERALLSLRDVKPRAVMESLDLIVERLQEELRAQRVGLEREARAKERAQVPGWREAVSAIEGALVELDTERERLSLDADSTILLLTSSSYGSDAADIVEAFAARWDRLYAFNAATQDIPYRKFRMDLSKRLVAYSRNNGGRLSHLGSTVASVSYSYVGARSWIHCAVCCMRYPELGG
jgi:CheY-like chemotaxis protein